MKVRGSFKSADGERGSVLILVLWVLMLVGYLSGEYLAHNRNKASLALNATTALQRSLAVESVLQLFAANGFSMVAPPGSGKNWIHLSPGGVNVSVRLGKEAGRIDLNMADDAVVRERIHRILGEDRLEEADHLADAVLDWRDADSLTRLHGAEAGFYKEQDAAYVPANGPFKVFTEALLVRGMTPEHFWGDPLSSDSIAEALEDAETGEDADTDDETDTEPQSFIESFTIYPKEVSRLEILIPGEGRGYYFELLFLQKINNRWQVIDRCRTFRVSAVENDEIFD